MTVQASSSPAENSFFSMVNPFASAPETGENTKTVNDVSVGIGSSNALVDGIRNFLSIPARIILWNSKINSGNVSAETIEKMKVYLHENGLHDVQISVNEYDPKTLWKRTFTNPKTSWFSKLIPGTMTCLMQTVCVPKLTGFPGDHFNTTANSIHLFSNDPAIALHECGHAKDFSSRKNPILYFFTNRAPHVGSIATLYHEYKATDNAVAYIKEKKWNTILAHSFKILIPAYATYCATAILPDTSITRAWKVTDLCQNPSSLACQNAIKSFSDDCTTSLLGMGAILLIAHTLGRVLAARVINKEEVAKEVEIV